MTQSTRAGGSTPPRNWEGTERYEVLGPIGEGGMGLVFEAYDRERQQHVALKTLHHFDPAALYLFKQEFRALAGVHHPNLVRLHELVVSDSGVVFFAMELVRGVTFVRYVHGLDAGAAPPGAPSESASAPTRLMQRRSPRPPASAGPRPSPPPVRHETPADIARLRDGLAQLVQGIVALHGAGKLHRDLKPANVLVTPEGRVVVLDFGVVAELRRPEEMQLASRGEVVGTARYMAPEQAVADQPSPASDWYSVGVVLYEALVGRSPFEGSVVDILTLKSTIDPMPPRDCVANVPEDLNSLCCALLQREPTARPTGPEILRCLGVNLSGIQRVRSDVEGKVSFVGREGQLEALHAAFAEVRLGRQTTVRVGGKSGMGKSTIVHQFLDEVAREGDAIVLRGRAYERESLPFKAVDSVVDALSLYLLHMADRDEPIALPAGVAALGHVFPVLRRVPGIADLAAESMGDPQRVRRRAFVALRDLLAAAASRKPLVVYIDDVQWGDTDSAALLVELTRPPDAPPLLLVMTYRDSEAHASPFLIETQARWPKGAEVRDLMVGPLDPEHATGLAFALLGSEDDARTIAADVARESGGSPFLVEELVGGLRERSSTGAGEGAAHGVATFTLEEMVRERVDGLPASARSSLELVAVEGRPLSVSVLRAAVGAAEFTDDVLSLLRARRFIRGGLRDGREMVEICHDRIRETLVAQLSVETAREHHRRLAEVLEASAGASPESVAVHLLGAGEHARGAAFAERAAELAAAKLAFDQAAHLFRLAVATIPSSSPDGRRLRVRLAQVLEWAGRGSDAARVYLDAAEGAPALERTELERAAAEHLLTCGRIDEGTEVLYRVLAAVGIEAPRSAAAVIFWLLVYRAWLRVRGLHFEPRAEEQVRDEDRLRIDALYAVSMGFAVIDVVLSACMTTRHLIAALRGGDRAAVLRAATLQMSLVAADGGVESPRDRALTETARRLAESGGSAEATAFFRANLGTSLYLRGRWRESQRVLDAAFAQYPNNRAGWQSNANVFCACALVYSGQLRELARRHPRWVADAQDRGDLYTLAGLQAGHPTVVWLAADDPATARRNVSEVMAQWPRRKYLVQHWQAMLCEAEIELYAGDGRSAYDRVARDARPLTWSLLLNAQIIRGVTYFVRGRAAVASVALAGARRDARLGEARHMTRRLERQRMPWTSAFASLVAAAEANARGERPAAIALLGAAIEQSGIADMTMHRAAANRHLGLLVGGDEGGALVRSADESMHAEGIVAPARWAAMLLPGSWGAQT